MQSKQKITLYIPPELHRKLKIRAAIDAESMSALVEKAVSFYIHNSDKVEESSSNSGKTHQVYFCPECESALVMRGQDLTSLKEDPGVLSEELPIAIRGSASTGESSSGEKLVIC